MNTYNTIRRTSTGALAYIAFLRTFAGALAYAATLMFIHGTASAQTAEPDTFTWTGGDAAVWNAAGAWDLAIGTQCSALGIADDIIAMTNTAGVSLTGAA